MPSRRSFTRSHNGCQNCKTRRVKCDEHFPRCYRCQKRGEDCSYSAALPNTLPDSSAAGPSQAPVISGALEQSVGAVDFHAFDPRDIGTASSSSHGNRASSRHSLYDAPDATGSSSHGSAGAAAEHDSQHSNVDQLDAADKALFDHYMTSTYRHMNENEKITMVLFGTIIPRYAQTHQFLMNCLLATAGEHCLSMLASGQETSFGQGDRLLLRERTLFHQGAALTAHTERIRHTDWKTATQEHCVAMCLASVFMLGFSMCGWDQVVASSQPGTISAIENAVEWLRLKAGITAVTQACWPQLKTSELSFLVTDPSAINPYKVDSFDDSLSNPQLKSLQAICSHNTIHSSYRRLYAAAITGLDQLYTSISVEPRAMGARWDWIRGRDAQELAEAVEAKQPEALLVLAHWAACLDPWPGAWWDPGFASTLKAEITQSLPAEYMFAMNAITTNRQLV